MDQADDLKAFERRMIEIVSSLHPSIWRWRLILLVLITVTLITFYALLIDNSVSSTASTTASAADTATANVGSLSASVWAYVFRTQIYFSVSFALLIFAFLFGIHRKMFASSIIIARFRYILADYNMSCDAEGRLILKPRPSPAFGGIS